MYNGNDHRKFFVLNKPHAAQVPECDDYSRAAWKLAWVSALSCRSFFSKRGPGHVATYIYIYSYIVLTFIFDLVGLVLSEVLGICCDQSHIFLRRDGSMSHRSEVFFYPVLVANPWPNCLDDLNKMCVHMPCVYVHVFMYTCMCTYIYIYIYIYISLSLSLPPSLPLSLSLSPALLYLISYI